MPDDALAVGEGGRGVEGAGAPPVAVAGDDVLDRRAPLDGFGHVDLLHDPRLQTGTRPYAPTRSATAAPATTSRTPSARPMRGPPGSTFSTNTTAANAIIHLTFIAPSASSPSISPQQQPMQYAPWCAPMTMAPRRPSRQVCIRNSSGERQWLRQLPFHGVSW